MGRHNRNNTSNKDEMHPKQPKTYLLDEQTKERDAFPQSLFGKLPLGIGQAGSELLLGGHTGQDHFARHIQNRAAGWNVLIGHDRVVHAPVRRGEGKSIAHADATISAPFLERLDLAGSRLVDVDCCGQRAAGVQLLCVTGGDEDLAADGSPPYVDMVGEEGSGGNVRRC